MSDSDQSESNVHPRVRNGLTSALIGLAILYISGWSLVIAGNCFPSIGPPSSQAGEVPIADALPGLRLWANNVKIASDGIVINSSMAAIGINSKPWGFVNSFRFFSSPVLQFVGLIVGLLFFVGGFSIPTHDTEEEAEGEEQ